MLGPPSHGRRGVSPINQLAPVGESTPTWGPDTAYRGGTILNASSSNDAATSMTRSGCRHLKALALWFSDTAHDIR
jgi:hypothetical protein